MNEITGSRSGRRSSAASRRAALAAAASITSSSANHHRRRGGGRGGGGGGFSGLRRAVALFLYLLLFVYGAVLYLSWPLSHDSSVSANSIAHRRAGGHDLPPLLRTMPKQEEPDHGGSDKERVLRLLRMAGVAEETLRGAADRLPSWEQVEALVGPRPVLLGLESCPNYRDSVPPVRRALGAAGMFSSGTNLATQLQAQLPHPREGGSVRTRRLQRAARDAVAG